jgi:hypothetical protein
MIKLKKRSLAILSYGTLALLFGVLCVIGFWLWYPYNPVTYYDLPYHVEPKIVKSGEELTYSFRYCKNTNLSPDIQRDYVDGIIFRSSNSTSLARAGCGTFYLTETIPTTLPAGNYFLQITIQYHMNPLRTITYVNRTEQFKVIE